MSEPTTLAALVGAHVLTGVDRLIDQDIPSTWDESNTYQGEVLRFTLDGVTYIAREDENDGYRSCMGDILVSDTPPVNTFPGVPIVATHYKDEKSPIDLWLHAPCDLLVMVRQDNGAPVLVVGTDDVGDYYPSFETWFNPEALGFVEGMKR